MKNIFDIKKYRIVGKFVLSFIIEDDQHDILLYASPDNHLEFDGKTVWYVTSKGEKYESITTPNIIDVALKNHVIEPINETES